MGWQSTLSKILLTIFSIAAVLIIADFLFFQSQNTVALVTAIQTAFAVNPLLSWGLFIFIISIAFLIGGLLYYRRRLFIQHLRAELDAKTDRPSRRLVSPRLTVHGW